MRLLHPWSDDLISLRRRCRRRQWSSQLAQGTDCRLRTPAFRQRQGNTSPLRRKRRRNIDRHVQLRQSPTRTDRHKPSHTRNCSTSWILPFCAGRSRLGQGPKPVPSMDGTLPKSLWIGQGHI